MTTIAWDGTTLSADKRCTNGAGAITVVTKILKLPDGRLVGASGNEHLCSIWMDWIVEKNNPIPDELLPSRVIKKKFSLPFMKKKFVKSIPWCQGLEIFPEGKFLKYDRGRGRVLEDKWIAIGSGSKYALGAMALGASSEQAISVAMQFDSNTGNGIDTLELN